MKTPGTNFPKTMNYLPTLWDKLLAFVADGAPEPWNRG